MTRPLPTNETDSVSETESVYELQNPKALSITRMKS